MKRRRSTSVLKSTVSNTALAVMWKKPSGSDERRMRATTSTVRLRKRNATLRDGFDTLQTRLREPRLVSDTRRGWGRQSFKH
jgi:hypothetical protein